MSKKTKPQKKEMKLPVKVATAKALKQLDYKLEEIADMLGISYKTAWRYTNKETPETWEKFVQDVKVLIDQKELNLSAKTLSQLEGKIPQAEFKELADWYIKLKDSRKGRVDTAVQINFNKVVENERKEFGI